MQKSEKIAAKKARVCVEKVCQYFEKNNVNDIMMQHTLAVAVWKVSEKKVPTEIEKYLTPVE
jgi:ribosomal protein L31E